MSPSPSTESLTGLAYWRASALGTAQSWRAMLDRKGIGSNISAGLTVALVALPLNLALAIACGLPPSVGLVTGAVAGVIGAIFGASRFQITGPEVALAPITLEIVLRHGFEGMLVVTFLAGLMQIGFGLFRVGRLVNAIPVPVIGGFLAAVGLLVFDSQLPRLFGLPGEVTHVSQLGELRVLGQVDLTTLVVGAVVVGVVVLLPRFTQRVPSPLAALAVAVGAVVVLGLPIAAVEPIEGAFPMPGFPSLAGMDIIALLPEAVALATLASIDSLLCAVSIDSRMGGERTRSDQELVAQGIANMGSALFGGMPVAAAVVRSVAAVEAGATTRMAPIAQSVLLGLVLVVLAPFVSFVPLVALAAILVVIGYRLIDWRQLIQLWKVARFEAAVFLVTAAGILLTDFVMGVGIGVVAALAHFAHQQRRALAPQSNPLEVLAAPSAPGMLTEPDAEVDSGERVSEREPQIVRLDGPLFFASQDRIEDMVRAAGAYQDVIVDVSGVTTVDVSGARALTNALTQLARRRDARVRLAGIRSDNDDLMRWVLKELESTGVEIADGALSEDIATSRAAPSPAKNGRWYEPAPHFEPARAPSSSRQEMTHGAGS